MTLSYRRSPREDQRLARLDRRRWSPHSKCRPSTPRGPARVESHRQTARSACRKWGALSHLQLQEHEGRMKRKVSGRMRLTELDQLVDVSLSCWISFLT